MVNLQKAALLLLLTTPLVSAENNQDQTYLEFLEFLGEWDTEDGDWLDPQLIDEDELEEPAPENSGQNK